MYTVSLSSYHILKITKWKVVLENASQKILQKRLHGPTTAGITH